MIQKVSFMGREEYLGQSVKKAVTSHQYTPRDGVIKHELTQKVAEPVQKFTNEAIDNAIKAKYAPIYMENGSNEFEKAAAESYKISHGVM